ncbi:hypothetical protein BEWA_007340 [Theileria equi strain WA]|uniref:Non-canonical E2 ubiquitin-conjugating enzyme C-terminal domain-containing protein n=1 Tax=Theileria equi strain WA TaxID=1537102 RepID=L0B0I5_THEEQ|nr:hypothetical protein BEWA_007340 [Theileria equi strain WA]AFZ81325.1 hypothetical protein BEWA_007340 [Theileria equi strain WA]|eukprot:XP_004830991.1 hypothetical protein BEWA_007340 [Theileria equi strain WA]
MRDRNKLSEILDIIELESENKPSDNTENKELDELVNLVHSLDKPSLFKVLNVVESKCNVSEIIKEHAPEAYSKHVMDPEMVVTDATTGIPLLDQSDDMSMEFDTKEAESSFTKTFDHEYYRKIAKYAPIRLTYQERKLMRLLDSTLHVSEYTDKVDIIHEGNKSRVILKEIKEVSAILSGLAIAYNYEAGQKLIRDREYHTNADFFRNIFEIGRRYKILNPDRMRNSYGKLVHFLMDSRKPEIRELLNFDCVAPVNTVLSFLSKKKNGLAMLADPKIKIATMEISPEGKTRSQIQHEIAMKEDAVKYMVSKYAAKKSSGLISMSFSFLARNFQSHDAADDDGMTSDEVESCLYSICDHHSHLRSFRRPCDLMISYLKENFNPNDQNPEYNLAINAGSEGSRLSHNHSRQYTYVLQSLSLWREIAHDMFALWHFAESDLLDSENPYRLRNTGQGLNRVQEGPHILNAMRQILRRVQMNVGTWVGSHAIHLGDHNVPNSFIFIDKYTQIPRILTPIVTCLEKIPELYNTTQAMKQYIDSQFRGPRNLKMTILTDFFRHAFDGSGADNFNDAGSCIDGRLTSAWNWCSKIEKKPYFPIFLLTGFCGFDGRFDEG